MRILLLSAYDASSHQRWRKGLVAAFPEFHWEVQVLPARYFNWRIRGNSLSWAYGKREILDQPYDLILATSMVDLATLKGLVPSLAMTPSIVYFHENQLAYPANERQRRSIEPAMVNIYSALAADRVVFNSEYNRSSFFSAVDQLLQQLPDHVPPGITEKLMAASQVLPVPVEAGCFQGTPSSSSGPLHIVWNHRWEYDKGPDRLLGVIELLLASKQVFRFSVVGEQFRERPAEFDEIKRAFSKQSSARLMHFGFVEDIAAYRKLLASADVVLSTALHDFQGLSVLEAVASGCLPLVPGRLCYGEWFNNEFCYDSFEDDAGKEAQGLAERLVALVSSKKTGLASAPSVEEFAWESLRPAYHRLLTEVVAEAGSLYDSALNKL